MSIKVKSNEVAGEYMGCGSGTGLVYKYRCCECGHKFYEHTPAISRPCICSNCYNGKRSPRGSPYDAIKESVRQMRKRSAK